MRTFLLVAAALVLAAPAMATHAPTGLRLVEGHTVFRALDGASEVSAFTLPSRGLGASTPVFGVDTLATPQPDPSATIVDYYPGVRWLNEQFVVDPVANWQNVPEYPDRIVRTEFSAAAALYAPTCSGAVLAVDAGAPDPRARLASATYLESYLFTDPNDARWITDVYEDGVGRIWVAQIGPHWTVEDHHAGLSTCSPVDGAFARPIGTNGLAYPGREAGALAGLTYDAVLVTFLEDLHAEGGRVSHAPGSSDLLADARDGNSHAYEPFPSLATGEAKRWHGGDADLAQFGTHATRLLDVYDMPDAPASPALEQFRLVDTEGSTAPFG